MALETYTGYIPALVETNPPATDPAAQGADHLRGIKLTLAQTFIGFTEPAVGVTRTASEINELWTETEANAALALKADIESPALTGIPTAPTAAPGDDSTQLATTAYADAAVAAAPGIGAGQTWQSPTRAVGSTYTNSTGRPIGVWIEVNITGNSGVVTLTVGGVAFGIKQAYTNNPTTETFGMIVVPDGQSYSLAASQASIARWNELR